MAGIMDKFIAIATTPHVVAQISLHLYLQPQTQAYPALATGTLFEQISEVTNNAHGQVQV